MVDNQETQTKPTFYETEVDPKRDPVGCVDGRADSNYEKWVQMLGGSLHPIYLAAFFYDRPLNDELLSESLPQLASRGFTIGFHRGAHRKEEEGRSDCGAADRVKDILTKIRDSRQEIMQRLLSAVNQMTPEQKTILLNIAGFSETGAVDLEVFLNEIIDRLVKYDIGKVHLTGESLISAAEEVCRQQGIAYTTQNLEADHAEQAVFINLKEGVTFDTREANRSAQQAFNLDLPIAVEQAEALGVERRFATLASLVIYQATEMVLVEDKGKKALPVIVHN